MVTNRDRKSFGSCQKKSKFAHTTGTVDVFDPRSGISGPTSRRASHVQIFMNDGPKPLTWYVQLLSYWFSRNPAVFQDWFVNLINNLWGGHCFGSSRTRRITGAKITTFNWVTQFLTVAYDGACSPNVSVRMAWISLGALPCRKKKLDDSSRLHVVEIARLAWHASFQPP